MDTFVFIRRKSPGYFKNVISLHHPQHSIRRHETDMNILFITPRLPYPPLKGDQAVPFNRLRILSGNHKITLLSFYEKEDDLKGLETLNFYCTEIHVVRLAKWKSMLNILQKSLFSALPMQTLYYQSVTFKRKIQEVLERNHFDLVHAYMFRVAPYLSSIQVPKILDLIDSMQLNLNRRVDLERIPRRWIYQEELRRVIPYESDIGRHFNHLILVSEKDRMFIGGDNVTVIPLGVDTDLFKPNEKRQTDPTIIFSGNMGYSPNISAILWFVEKCFSKIQMAIPNASLIIAGGNPSSEIHNLARVRGIKVTGFVDSMPDAINQASVAIAPMLSGSGMQFKILEAMACGLPVVTTSLGLGSIKAKKDEEIVMAETPNDFATAVISILLNNDLANNIGTRAREFVMKNHSWLSSAMQVDELYHTVLNNPDK